MSTLRLFFEKHSIYWLWIILAVSTYLKFAYVFFFAEYHNYLFGEMGELWRMAADSFYNGDIDTNQWTLWSPIAHIALAWVFKILYFFDLYQHKLEMVLGINIIMSTLSVTMVYLMALRLFASGIYALLVAFIYAFFFQLVYFNTFVLIENPAIFLYLLAITILLYNNNDNLRLFVTGVVLGIAIAYKPIWILSVFPFVGYVLFGDSGVKANISKTMSLLAGFVLFLFLVIVNNNAISTGKLKSLSTNEGLDYYLASCGKHSLVSTADDSRRTYIPSSTKNTPERGISSDGKAFYEQSYYYKKGMECAKQNPPSIKDRLSRFGMLYADTMYPMVAGAKYAKKWLPVFDNIAFWLSLLLVFVPFMYFDSNLSKPTLSLLVTLILSQLLLLGSVDIEQRDLYGFFFGIVLLGFLVPFVFAHTIRWAWWAWLGCLMLLLGGGLEYASKTPIVSKHIAMTISQQKHNIYDLDQDRDAGGEFRQNINTINFKGQYTLEHGDMGSLKNEKNFFVDMRVGVNLLQDKNIIFEVVSDDGYRISIDKKELISDIDTKSITIDTNTTLLTKGKHRLDLSYFQSDKRMAFRVYYTIDKKRRLVGEDSKYLKFFYLNKDEYFQQKKVRKKRQKAKKTHHSK